MKSTPSASSRRWLVKSEPETYSWADFVRDRTTDWTGVRNYAARLHLNAMQVGDQVLFYESVSTKAVRGLARVTRKAFPDATADEPGWVAVQLEAIRPLSHPVPLERIKQERSLARMVLLNNSRLSVQPVTAAEFATVVKAGDQG